MEFRYNKQADLIYHILAHMKVANASDLYSEAYIEAMKQIRKEELSLPKVMETYYHHHFQQLAMIQFLPFYCQTLSQLIQIIREFQGIDNADKEEFIKPWIALLKQEAIWYFPYWEQNYQTTARKRAAVEQQIANKFVLYQRFFTYHQKKPVAYFSFVLANQGRGIIGSKQVMTAVSAFPQSPQNINSAFFTFLHEYTHQATDILVAANIKMTDQSHQLSEHAAIIFDYELIKRANVSDVEPYLQWVASVNGIGKPLTVQAFLEIFTIPAALSEKLQALINAILCAQKNIRLE